MAFEEVRGAVLGRHGDVADLRLPAGALLLGQGLGRGLVQLAIEAPARPEFGLHLSVQGVLPALECPGLLPLGALAQPRVLVAQHRKEGDGLGLHQLRREGRQVEVHPAPVDGGDGHEVPVVVQALGEAGGGGEAGLGGRAALPAREVGLDAVEQPVLECIPLLLRPGGPGPAALVLRALDEADVAVGLDQRDAPLHQAAVVLRPALGDLGEGGRAVAGEPGGLDLAPGHAPGQHDLEGALAQLDLRRLGRLQGRRGTGRRMGKAQRAHRVGPVTRRVRQEPVEPITAPVQLLLQGDHPAAEGQRSPPGRVQGGAGRGLPGAEGGGEAGGELLREAVQAAGEVGGVGFGEGELLELGAVVLEALPSLRSAIPPPMPPLPRPALVVADLLHPEAARGAVQQPEQGEVVVLARARRELDDRRRAVEDLAAPVEDEVVVGGDEGEGDR